MQIFNQLCLAGWILLKSMKLYRNERRMVDMGMERYGEAVRREGSGVRLLIFHRIHILLRDHKCQRTQA